jgi:hypothetical protein
MAIANWKGYVQLNTGGISSTRPYDWSLVAVGETKEICKSRVTRWIRDANRHQSKPCMYHVLVKEGR